MLCVLAKLSDDATEKLNALKGSAIPDNEGAKPLHGHITLASYEGEDEAGFTRSCKELFNDIRHFDIRYEKNSDDRSLGADAGLLLQASPSGLLCLRVCVAFLPRRFPGPDQLGKRHRRMGGDPAGDSAF